MSDDVTKSLAFKNSMFENQPKKSNNEERRHLFQYKQKFDLSYAHYGVVKPLMGGSGYKDKILGGSCKSNLDGIDISTLSQKPLLNLLHISDLHSKGRFTRQLYYFYYATSKRTDHEYLQKSAAKKAVLADERLRHAILTTVEENKCIQSKESVTNLKLKKKLLQKASRTVDEMIASVSSTALKLCGWLFLMLLRRLTDAVHIHEGQLDVLKQILQEENPTIYFPLHFSHFDYILISLITYCHEMRSPFVASGNNLLIQPFSAIMRRLGGFFIRRKIDDGNSKDLIYRALLHSYVTKLLKNGQSLEIFIEGTRTRSGLPNLPKTGLLSVAVDAVKSGSVSDINLVPVCISYEKVPEGTFRTELLGQPKQPETFLSSIISMCKIFFGYYGHIRINFGVPQSLKKTMQELMTSSSCTYSHQCNENAVSQPGNHPSTTEPNTNDELNAGAHFSAHESADSTIISYEVSEDENQSRELVTFLAERIVYSSLKCKVFMSTNLVAFLLLHRWRQGVTLSQLVGSFRQLTTELFTRGSDVGFSGDYRDVVLHALVLLGSELVQLDYSHSTNMKRSSSNASIRSRKSADSGYDLEDPVDPPALFKGSLSPAVDKKVPQSGSDSGEEMSFSDPEEQLTGNFMATSASTPVQNDTLTVATMKERISTLPQPKRMTERFATSKPPKLDSSLFIVPVLQAPPVFDLAYYSNALTPVFALESIVALSVGAVTHYRFSALEKKLQMLTEDQNVSCVQVDIEEFPESISRSFLRSKLIEKALELSDLLQMDLILCDVTQNLEEAVSEAIDHLTTRGCFIVEEYGNSASTRKSHAAQELGFNEFQIDSDQWMKIDLEQLSSLISVQSVMSGFVEAYVAAGSKLTCLLLHPLNENDLRREMISAAQRRVDEGLAIRNESCSSDMIRNAVRSFEWTGVLVRDQINKKELRLSKDFKDAENIASLVSRISQFLF